MPVEKMFYFYHGKAEAPIVLIIALEQIVRIGDP